jgi:GNAT superfamily N-acetyltransferase
MTSTAPFRIPARALQIEPDGMFGVLMRPICPDDEPLIAEGIMDLSREARRFRFFGELNDVPEQLLHDLANVDGVTHIAWGALVVSGATAKPAAAVHAIRRDPSDPQVDLACTVIDAYQGRGLAKLLMAAVLRDCHALGIRTAIADVLPTNTKARHLFLSLGARRVYGGTDTCQDYQLELDIAETLDRLDCAQPGPSLPKHLQFDQAAIQAAVRVSGQAANPMR